MALLEKKTVGLFYSYVLNLLTVISLYRYIVGFLPEHQTKIQVIFSVCVCRGGGVSFSFVTSSALLYIDCVVTLRLINIHA